MVGGELVAEGAAGVVLHQAQLLHGHAYAVGYHGHMQVDADGLGMDGDHSVLVYIGIAAVRLQMQVGLAGAVGMYLYHVGCGIKVEVRPLDAVGLVVGVGSAGVDLYGVLGDGVHGVHVSGQFFYVHHHRIGGGSGVGLGIGGHYGYGVAELEYLLVTEHRAVPAVALVVQRQHDQAVYPVLAAGGYDVLGGDDLGYAGHLLGGGGVHGFYESVAHLGLDQGQAQRALRHLQGIVSAEVPGAGDLLGGRGSDVLGAHNGVAGGLEDKVFLADLASNDSGGIHDRIHQGLIAGAAAEVAVLVEPVPYLLTGGGGVVVQQHLGADDKAGGAEAALGAAVGHPGHLQRMHVGYGAHALYGGDLGAVFHLAHLHDA